MANEEQLAILRQGVEVWNKWREENHSVHVALKKPLGFLLDLRRADFKDSNLINADLSDVDLEGANLYRADLRETDFNGANLSEANLREADLEGADLSFAYLNRADLKNANLSNADFFETILMETKLHGARFGDTTLTTVNLSLVYGLETTIHRAPSNISINVLQLSEGKIPEAFLRGCGLSDWEIESAKLYKPELSNQEISAIIYKIFDLRSHQAIQIFPLFISYSHGDSTFVDKLESYLDEKGIRFWRDIHDMKAGRIEKQIDRAIRQNPTVLLVLSEHSLNSDWVEHEVRTARELEKEMGRDVLCPVALDHSWKESRWPKRIMEQITEYSILDFAAWRDDAKFDGMFRKLIDGLELFYKG